jgi:hypothetical protein
MIFSTTDTETQTDTENQTEPVNLTETQANNKPESENKAEAHNLTETKKSFGSKKNGLRRTMSEPPLDSLPYKKRNIKLRSTSPPTCTSKSYDFDVSDDNFVPNSPYVPSNEFSSNEFSSNEFSSNEFSSNEFSSNEFSSIDYSTIFALIVESTING